MACTTIITAKELAEHTSDADWGIVDCRFALNDPNEGRRRYDAGHLPGARYAHLDDDLASPVTATSGRHPLPSVDEFRRKLGEWGIGESTQVVAYDAAGGMFAARLWWLMRWLGHKNVAVLDGGFGVWQAAGLPITIESPAVGEGSYSPKVSEGMTLSADQVATGLAGESITLVDARDAVRYSGETEPLDPVAGHVPGAVNRPCKQNLDESGCFLPNEQLRKRFAELAGQDNVVHMCGSGVTACHNMLAMEVAGLPSGKLYPGSWSEWIRDSLRPVAARG